MIETYVRTATLLLEEVFKQEHGTLRLHILKKWGESLAFMPDCLQQACSRDDSDSLGSLENKQYQEVCQLTRFVHSSMRELWGNCRNHIPFKVL